MTFLPASLLVFFVSMLKREAQLTTVVRRLSDCIQLEDTIAFAQILEKSGVAAVGIHGRRRNERQGDQNRVDEIREIARLLSVPVIAK